MILNSPAVVAQIIGFGLFLWVGLYVFLRGGRVSAPMAVSLAGLFAQALFFGSGALTDTRESASWFMILQRWTLWTSVVPAALWYHFSSLVVRRAAPGPDPPSVVAIYTAAAVLTLIGTFSDLVVDYRRPLGAPGAYVIAAGPAYIFYMGYLAIAAAGALLNFVRAWREARAAAYVGLGGGIADRRALATQLGVLAVGALLFLVGALWITARKSWDLPISVVPGFLCLFGGLAALGWGVAHFGLLLDGQHIQRDFLYNLTGIGVLNLLYCGLLALVGTVTVEGALAVVALVTLTHSTFDVGRRALDVLFFSRAERDARAEAREYATALGTTPVTAALSLDNPAEPPGDDNRTAEAHDVDQERSLKAFRAEVRKALTGLKSPPRLARSPLLSLPVVERRVRQSGLEDNRLNRAAALRELLIEQIEGLRPSAGEASAGAGRAAEHHVGEAWRFYNVLHYPYVRELSRKGALAEARRLAEERRREGQRVPGDLEQVLTWLADVDEDTFYKWQRRASDTIAGTLWDEHAMPTSADLAVE